MVEMAVAAQVSPAGASVAGSYGLGQLSISATSTGGFNALATNWEIYERKALENNHPVDRKRWSLVRSGSYCGNQKTGIRQRQITD